MLKGFKLTFAILASHLNGFNVSLKILYSLGPYLIGAVLALRARVPRFSFQHCPKQKTNKNPSQKKQKEKSYTVNIYIFVSEIFGPFSFSLLNLKSLNPLKQGFSLLL